MYPRQSLFEYSMGKLILFDKLSERAEAWALTCSFPGKQGQTSIRSPTEALEGLAGGTVQRLRRLPLPP